MIRALSLFHQRWLFTLGRYKLVRALGSPSKTQTLTIVRSSSHKYYDICDLSHSGLILLAVSRKIISPEIIFRQPVSIHWVRLLAPGREQSLNPGPFPLATTETFTPHMKPPMTIQDHADESR